MEKYLHRKRISHNGVNGVLHQFDHLSLSTDTNEQEWPWIGLPCVSDEYHSTPEPITSPSSLSSSPSLLIHPIHPPSFHLLYVSKLGHFLSNHTNRLRIVQQLLHTLSQNDINEENICCLNTGMIFFIFARRKGQLLQFVHDLCVFDEV
jgi:hypothetical protein